MSFITFEKVVKKDKDKGHYREEREE